MSANENFQTMIELAYQIASDPTAPEHLRLYADAVYSHAGGTMYNGWTEPYEQTIARANRIRAAHDAAVAERERIAAENVALTRQAEARAERLDKLIECRCVLPEHVCPACRAAATTGLEPDEIPF
jgi:hypothetical protein